MAVSRFFGVAGFGADEGVLGSESLVLQDFLWIFQWAS